MSSGHVRAPGAANRVGNPDLPSVGLYSSSLTTLLSMIDEISSEAPVKSSALMVLIILNEKEAVVNQESRIKDINGWPRLREEEGPGNVTLLTLLLTRS